MERLLCSRIRLLLLVIIFIAGLLRFADLHNTPISLYWDETAIAYNAYSIFKTGKDEYGTFLPILFRSFDDYKMPGLIYLSVPIVSLLGLTEFSARFTSAFVGTLTVLFLFLLTHELFTNAYTLFIKRYSELIALTSSLLLAISPWHFQVSRAGFEANAALFMIILCIWWLLKSLREGKSLWVAVFLIAGSFYFYLSTWVFLPFLITVILYVHRKFLLQTYKFRLIVYVGLLVLLLMPIISQLLTPEGQTRFRQTNLASNMFDEVYAQSLKIQGQGGNLISRIMYNRRWVYFRVFLTNYFSHFSPRFLFWRTDANDRGRVSNHGMFYAWESIFLLLGLLTLIKLKGTNKFIILTWLFISPLPGSATTPAPHILRSLNLVPVLCIIIALGLIWAYSKLTKFVRFLAILVWGEIVIFFAITYLFMYFGPWKYITSEAWADGYKQLTEYVFVQEKNYEQIVISGHYWKPYIYFLFYKQYDPSTYQKLGAPQHFDKYVFGGTSWGKGEQEFDRGDLLLKLIKEKKSLIALSPLEYERQSFHLCQKHLIYNHYHNLIFVISELKSNSCQKKS